jgi:hypothetical protein
MNPPDIPPPLGAPPAPAAEPRQASLIQVAGAVFWSFFGVRKGKAMQRDAVTIKPLQVIVVGVVFAALLVFALLALVRVILRVAG